MSAAFSPCKSYRYELRRHWGDPQSANILALCGANPSTAGAEIDDNTIRKETAFAKREGCDGIVKVNVAAFCATDPKKCPSGVLGFGPNNEQYLRQICQECPVIVVAWGNVAQDEHVRWALKIFQDEMATLMCFGINGNGSPKHPLYLRNDAPLIMWPGIQS